MLHAACRSRSKLLDVRQKRPIRSKQQDRATLHEIAFAPVMVKEPWNSHSLTRGAAATLALVSSALIAAH